MWQSPANLEGQSGRRLAAAVEKNKLPITPTLIIGLPILALAAAVEEEPQKVVQATLQNMAMELLARTPLRQHQLPLMVMAALVETVAEVVEAAVADIISAQLPKTPIYLPIPV